LNCASLRPRVEDRLDQVIADLLIVGVSAEGTQAAEFLHRAQNLAQPVVSLLMNEMQRADVSPK